MKKKGGKELNHDFYRSSFPILATHTHLASCSQGALAKSVSKAIEEYHNSILLSGTNWNEAIRIMDETRVKFAELIGAETDEVAVLCSVSDAISAIATSLSYQQEKNKVVFTDIDFPTVGHIWFAQEQFKDHISVIRSSNGEIPLEQYEKEITTDTLITCIPHVNYYNGYKQNVREIADIVHRKGSLLFVDAYQSAGHIPIDVKEMKIDILATGTRRFETGTPSFISVYAAYEALKLLLGVGIGKIEFYLKELTQFTIHYGTEKGLHLSGPLSTDNRTSLMSFHVENASKVEGMLRDKKIIVSARKDVIRIAPHFYNIKDEIKYAIDELAILINGK